MAPLVLLTIAVANGTEQMNADLLLLELEAEDRKAMAEISAGLHGDFLEEEVQRDRENNSQRPEGEFGEELMDLDGQQWPRPVEKWALGEESRAAVDGRPHVVPRKYHEDQDQVIMGSAPLYQ